MEVISKVKGLSERLIVVVGDDPLSVEAQRNATIMFQSLLRSTLASKRCLSEFKLSPDAFEWLIGEIDTRFNAVSYSYFSFPLSLFPEPSDICLVKHLKSVWALGMPWSLTLHILWLKAWFVPGQVSIVWLSDHLSKRVQDLKMFQLLHRSPK